MDPLQIPVRSQRQAMDWSLVLVSQDIETAIEYSEPLESWMLTVPAADYERALEVIRQYRRENRGWPWQRPLVLPEVVFDAGSLLWALLLTAFFWLSVADPHLRSGGIMDSAAVSHGQWWRLLTAIFLHGDLGHLASNLAIGTVLMGLTMGRFGTGIGLLAALLAGVGANVLVWRLGAPAHQNLGASGMIMGALGLLAVQSFVAWRHGPGGVKSVLTAVAGGVLLFMLLGLTPGTDVLAHASGFVCGIGLGLVLTQLPLLARNGRVNLAAGFVFAALVIVAWWRALAGIPGATG